MMSLCRNNVICLNFNIMSVCSHRLHCAVHDFDLFLFFLQGWYKISGDGPNCTNKLTLVGAVSLTYSHESPGQIRIAFEGDAEG